METSVAHFSPKEKYGDESIKSNTHISYKNNQMHSSVTLVSEAKTMIVQSGISKSIKNPNPRTEIKGCIFLLTHNLCFRTAKCIIIGVQTQTMIQLGKAF
jgi:hypothetical protein